MREQITSVVWFVALFLSFPADEGASVTRCWAQSELFLRACVCVTKSDILSVLKLILWNHQNNVFQIRGRAWGSAYLLVGVGAPEDMSIVSFMLLATGFGWLKDKIRGL